MASLIKKNDLASVIKRLIKQNHEIWLSVAWANNFDIFQAFCSSPEKLQKVVVGTHFYQTDTRALELLKVNRPSLLVAFQPYKMATRGAVMLELDALLVFDAPWL